jgi:hypothetical protein
MTRIAQQETVELYTRTLRTMTEVLDELHEEPDPDGRLADLAGRIEAEREWVHFLMALGEEPTRPPGWLRRAPAALVREQRRLLTEQALGRRSGPQESRGR